MERAQKILEKKDILAQKGYNFERFLPERKTTRNIIAYATNIRNGLEYVIKFSEDFNQIDKEYIMLQRLNHNNIIKAIEVVELIDIFGLVLAKAEGGDLYEHLTVRISHYQIQHIMQSLLTSLKVIHQNQLIHFDVKIGNILIMGKTLDSEIVLADFESLTPSDNPVAYWGTEGFMAPEILEKKKVDSKCDIWSAGAVMFYIYYREDPLKHRVRYSINFPSKSLYNDIPKEAIDLMRELLRIPCKTRITAEEALEHNYFKIDFHGEQEAKIIRTYDEIAHIVKQSEQIYNDNVEINNYTDQK